MIKYIRVIDPEKEEEFQSLDGIAALMYHMAATTKSASARDLYLSYQSYVWSFSEDTDPITRKSAEDAIDLLVKKGLFRLEEK